MELPISVKFEKEDEEDVSIFRKKQALENAFLEALDVAERVMKAQENLQKTLQNGFFDLVCARYNMGQLRVSRLQWNDRLMDAITLVDVFENGKSINGVDGQRENNSWFMKLRQTGDKSGVEHESNENDTFVSEGDGPGERNGGREGEGEGEGEGAGLRRRRNKGRTGETEERANEEREGQSSFESADRSVDEGEELPVVSLTPSQKSQKSENVLSLEDPLRWFGGLVSPGLKKAQSNFKEATRFAVELANAQRDLKIAMDRYLELESKQKS